VDQPEGGVVIALGGVRDHLRSIRGKPVTLDAVRTLGRHAFLVTQEGILFVHDQSSFWFTDLDAEVPQSEPVGDEASLPLYPWYHHPRCDCAVCQPD
jgi:hypothetical protein